MVGSNLRRPAHCVLSLGLIIFSSIIYLVQFRNISYFCRLEEQGSEKSFRIHVTAKNNDGNEIMPHVKKNNNGNVIIPRVNNNNGNVKVGIHLIGERHSGTNWILSHLKTCFAHSIEIKPVMSRFKHWFQVDKPGKSNYGLVIAQFRNVYDWVLAMKAFPHHALGHWNVRRETSIPWKEFVTRPWTFDVKKYSAFLKNYTETMKLYEEGHIDKTSLNDIGCMDKFTWKEVIPCTKGDRKRARRLTRFAGPLYELNRERPGVPYKNIFEMRRDKIINFRREVPNFDSVENYIPLRYEDMVQKGTNNLIRSIESKMNVKARCKPSPPNRLDHKKYPEGFIKWVNKHVDWDTESLVGYEKLDAS